MKLLQCFTYVITSFFVMNVINAGEIYTTLSMREHQYKPVISLYNHEIDSLFINDLIFPEGVSKQDDVDQYATKAFICPQITVCPRSFGIEGNSFDWKLFDRVEIQYDNSTDGTEVCIYLTTDKTGYPSIRFYLSKLSFEGDVNNQQRQEKIEEFDNVAKVICDRSFDQHKVKISSLISALKKALF